MLGLGLGIDKAFSRAKKTFYVRPSGGTYGTEDGTSYENAWDGFSNINWSAVENNILAVCGTHNESLVVGASNITIIGNDSNEAGIIDGQDSRNTGLDVNSRNNVTVNNISVIDHVVQNLMIRGTSAKCVTNNCTFNGSGNQGIQHENTATATHNNPTCSNNVDDGISIHDSAVVIINGGTFANNDQAINAVGTSNVTINDNPTFTSNTSYDVWVTNATTDESAVITINSCNISGVVSATLGGKLVFNDSTISDAVFNLGFLAATDSIVTYSNSGSTCIFNSCIVTLKATTPSVNGNNEFNKCRVTNDIIVTSGELKARHTLFIGGDDIQLDFQSGATADIAYCIFYNMATNQFGVAFRTGSTVTNYTNCTHVGVSNVGRGAFLQQPLTGYNHIYQDLDIATFQNTGAVTLENCAFWNNNTDKSGTITSNDEVTTNPNLADPSNLDFSLGSGSSCIGAGETRTISEGIASANWGDGVSVLPIVNTKEQGDSWDIGAYIS